MIFLPSSSRFKFFNVIVDVHLSKIKIDICVVSPGMQYLGSRIGSSAINLVSTKRTWLAVSVGD
jgi:hypothetical protein